MNASLNDQQIASLLEKEKELEILGSCARAVLKNEDFDTTARAIFDNLCKYTGATAGYVALLSDDGAENEVLFLESGGSKCTVDPELPMPIRGLRADAYHMNKVVYHNDFDNSDWVKFMPEGHMTLDNVMFSPLVIEGKTVGIIGISNKPSDFSDEDERVAGILGEFAALALSNSWNLEKLKKSEERLDLAINGTSDGIWDWTDVNKDQEYWSPKFYEHLGYRDQEIPASYSRFKELIHPDDLVAYSKVEEDHFNNNTPYDIEFRLRCKNGKYKWFRNRGTLYRRDGQAERMTGCLTDIQKEKDYLKEQEKLKNQLFQSSKLASLGTLGAGVAHELNNPLSVIDAYLFKLGMLSRKDQLDIEAVKKGLSSMKTQVDRMAKIISHIKEYSRFSNVSLMEEVTLDDLIDESLVLIKQQMHVHNIKVEVNMDSDLPPILVNKINMVSVLQNLITNARDAILAAPKEREKRISVSASFDDELFTLKISDTGTGISPETTKEIFDPFFTTKPTGEGTGLGLSLAHSIISQHQGSIEIESSNQNGTTFIIKLPQRHH